jgi:hypothetical protein
MALPTLTLDAATQLAHGVSYTAAALRIRHTLYSMQHTLTMATDAVRGDAQHNVPSLNLGVVAELEAFATVLEALHVDLNNHASARGR